MHLTPANGTSVSNLNLNDRKVEEGIALAGLVDVCNDMIDTMPEYGRANTYEMEPGYVPPSPKLF